MEKQEKLDKALEWYEKARATRPMIANFAPWRRSVIVRLRRQADGDLENALKECVELVDLLDKLARTSETYDDGTDRVIAINIEFVGRVFGFVHSLSSPGTRRFVSSIQSEERTILAMFSGFPTPDNFSALYEAAKNDVEAEFVSRKNMEDEFDRISKLLAESKKERVSQGEIESRKTYGPHETAPNGIDYYEDHGLNGKEKALDNRMYDDSMQRSTSDGRGRSGNAEPGNDVPAQLLLDDLVGNSGDGEERIDPRHLLPDVNKSLITRDTKVLMEWIIKHEVWFRKSARASEYVQTYFPMNLELERQKLFKTFPDHLERSQPLFATTTLR